MAEGTDAVATEAEAMEAAWELWEAADARSSSPTFVLPFAL